MSLNLQLMGSLATRVGTNYAATDAELAEIKRLLRDPETKSKQLEEEIALAEARLKNLREQKNALDESMHSYRALLSPIRRLPRDLLQEIFLACLPRKRNPSMSIDEPPMLLTHVCRQWRHVALHTPRLWAAIHIPIPSVPRNHQGEPLSGQYSKRVADIVERRMCTANEWFERSGVCPLSISLHEWNSHWAGDMFATVAKRCLIPFCRRWKDISLTACASSFRPFQKLSAADTPLLESLHLQLTTITGPPLTADINAPWKHGSILQSPRLTRFQISGQGSDIPYGLVHWGRITTLVIEGARWNMISHPDLKAIMNILRQCAALIECTVQVGSGIQDRNDETQKLPIILPHLEALTVEERHGGSFLRQLHAPSLQQITYSRTPGVVGAIAASPLLGFLTSNPDVELKELHTSCASMSAADFLACLKCCPSLRTLHIKTGKYVPPTVPPIVQTIAQGSLQVELNDSLLAALAPASVDVEDILCPKLEDVEFMMDTKFSEEAVLGFIRRKQSGEDERLSKLRRVRFHFFRKKPFNKDVQADVKPFVDEGLYAELLYNHPLMKGPFSLYDGLPTIYPSFSPFPGFHSG
ncbi:hypothetical protein NLJ89_g9104 [Agrocybe chaxingu]|uniref:F-box domain-containing protein n=1 Tax=Agrocybe chaxingu TaxID=84603 RepID=A0A9W8K0L6_9AGAR|nr:hypothetical protein NLJ89_g9104 [Agrocybe chaxingu]